MTFEGLGERLRPWLLVLGGLAWSALALGAAFGEPALGRFGYGLLLAIPWVLVTGCLARALRRRAWSLAVISILLLALALLAARGGLGAG